MSLLNPNETNSAPESIGVNGVAITRLFIEPLDVLFFRGNKNFGDSGSYGESYVPPRPSVVAGALRSGLIANRGYDPSKFAQGEITTDSELGTPELPGSFVLTRLNLAQRIRQNGADAYQLLFPLPFDLFAKCHKTEKNTVAQILRSRPWSNRNVSQESSCILTSRSEMSVPVLPENERSKPLPNSQIYLTAEGWKNYINGGDISPDQNSLAYVRNLWQTETRIGIGLDAERRSANEREGKLFTTQAVSFRKQEHGELQKCDVGFFAEVGGATFPESMTIRLGGDGRGALVTKLDRHSESNKIDKSILKRITETKRCRLILTSPGVFSGGWHFLGSDGDTLIGEVQTIFDGVKAKIECAAIPRFEVISGFDISKWQPKPAHRVVPTGSVYWLTNLDATAESLANFVNEGLWQSFNLNPQRRAEGFNRFELGIYGES